MLNDYNQLFTAEVLPLLRKQKGFRGEFNFCNANGRELTAISLWDTREHADLYANNTYADVIKLLSRIIDGTPTVRTEDVIQSSFMPSLVEPAAA
jgi:hypothetical protein